MILRKINMKNTTIELNRPEAPIVSARRNNFTALNKSVRTNVLPANPDCAREIDGFGVAPLNNRPSARNAEPWRSALLEDQGLFVEKCVYGILGATVAVSLLMAFWQLSSLDAGWTSFVDLVGRIVS